MKLGARVVVIPRWDPELDAEPTLPELWERIGRMRIASLPEIHTRWDARRGHEHGDEAAVEEFLKGIETGLADERAVIASASAPVWSWARAQASPPGGQARRYPGARSVDSAIETSARRLHAAVKRPVLGRGDLAVIARRAVAAVVRRPNGEVVWESPLGLAGLGETLTEIEDVLGYESGHLRNRAFRDPLITLQRRGASITLGPAPRSATAASGHDLCEVVVGERPARLAVLNAEHELWVCAGSCAIVGQAKRDSSASLFAATRGSSLDTEPVEAVYRDWRLKPIETVAVPTDAAERNRVIERRIAAWCGLPIAPE